MAKAIYLSAWFITGCIASSLIAWLGMLHPALVQVVLCIYLVALAVWGMCWLTDDAIAKFLKVELIDYYAILIATGTAAIIGGLLCWLLGN